MADKNKFVKPELKKYSAKKLLTQDRLMNAMIGIREIQTKLWETMPDDQYEKLEPEFDTAIAAMMALLNDFYKKGSITKGELKTFLILLNPVAPHITEEMWADCGFGGRLYQQAWPEYDEAKTVENTVEIAVQINGKTKGTVSIARDCDKDTAIAAGKEVIKDKLTGNIIKEIYVPGRIINIVMK